MEELKDWLVDQRVARAVRGDARVLRDAQRPDLAEPIYLDALANRNATPFMRAEFAAERASTLWR